MSTIRSKAAACVLCWLLVGALAPWMRAEVSADTEAAVNVLILGVIEGPDPISQTLWQPVRLNVDPRLFLNPDGAERLDGRPSIAFDPTSGWPHVSWAYYDDGDFQIAYSLWVGAGWSTPQFLSSTPAAELDPRIHAAEDGSLFVTWWDDGERVWLSQQPAAAAPWASAEQVTALTEAGRRPSTALWLGQALVAYERNGAIDGQEIVVATRTAPQVYEAIVVATTMSKEPLDVMLHVVEDRLWVDWRHDADSFAWTQWKNGSWGPVHLLPWTDDTWAGQEEARRYIADMTQPAR